MENLKVVHVAAVRVFRHDADRVAVEVPVQPELHDPDVQAVLVEQQHALEVVERVHVGGVVPVLLRRLRVTERPGGSNRSVIGQ